MFDSLFGEKAGQLDKKREDRRKPLLLAALLLLLPELVTAETFLHGAPIYPAFEGWRPNSDGTFNLMFGYMNENWEEEPRVEIGDNNFFSPGEIDRGQPTNFMPRRNRFTFEVTVPADWGDRELVWNLNINGVETKAYGTLKPDYLVDNMVIASETGSLGIGVSSPESRSNTTPTLTLQGDSVRTANVGEQITLIAHLEDDGLPRSRVRSTRSERDLHRAMFRAPQKPTVNKINALFLSWNVYRGDGAVNFDPPQTKVWEDTRVGANSPWGSLWLPPEIPEDGMIETTVTFDKPGTYVLWGRADDGGLYADTYVTVNVTP
ncbi:MAG: hypothetical protein CMQ41_03920 [Gammaproteobacteria bacterium]|nr:hypothetical protein [Gammaproteobacteria bacterium]|tara:strand:+ start:2984 stop:3943 length:960 start_codon:yes stop_codon:yes gene_type:complete